MRSFLSTLLATFAGVLLAAMVYDKVQEDR